MSSEQDHTLIAILVDYLWALFLLIVGGVVKFVYSHEQRVTILEEQHKETMRATERAEVSHSEIKDDIKHLSSKLDRILGFCSAKHRNGQ